MKKFDYFPRGPQNETVSNLFGDVLSSSFNFIGQFMKKCYLLLFLISVAIGQFSSKWPGSSSCTVTISYLNERGKSTVGDSSMPLKELNKSLVGAISILLVFKYLKTRNTMLGIIS